MRTPHFGKRLLALAGFFLLFAGGMSAAAAPDDLVDHLISQLRSADYDRRQDAFYALWEIDDPRVLPALLAILKDSDITKQDAVIGTLRRMEKQDHSTPALIATLQHPDPMCRRAAAEALSERTEPRAFVPLCAALRDSDKGTRALAAMTLGWQRNPAAIPALLDALHDPQREIQGEAANALGQIGAPVDLLLPLLRDTDPLVRAGGATALGRIRDARAVAPLVTLLKDPEEKPRQMAAWALRLIGVPAIPSLAKRLETGSAAERILTTGILIQIPGGNNAALLAPALHDPDPQVRTYALMALGLNDASSREALWGALQDPDLKVRRKVLRRLHYGPDILPSLRYRDPRLVGVLIPLLNSPDHILRCGAIWSLALLGDRRAVEPIAALLPDKSVRTFAAAALARFGDMRALPSLIESLKEQIPSRSVARPAGALISPEEYENSALPLIDLPEESLDALGIRVAPSMFKLLKTGMPKTKCWAMAVLADCGDFRAVPRLLPLLDAKDPAVRVSAARALVSLGDLRAMPRLMQVLRHDPVGNVRWATIYELGKSPDPRLVPALLAALKDSDPSVRKAAFHVLADTHDPRAIEPVLAALKGNDAEARACALKMSYVMHQPQVIPALLQVLKDLPLMEQLHMEDLFRGAWDPRMVDYYEKYLDSYYSSYERGEVALILAWMKDPRAISPLFQSLRMELHVHPDTVAEALVGLGPVVVDPCLRALNEPFPYLRAGAARTLGLFKERRAVPQLITLLRDPENMARLSAARALTDIADPRATDALITALADEDDNVVEYAAKGLMRLRAARACTPLLAASQRKFRFSNSGQIAAAEALGALGNPAAIPSLLALLPDPSPALRKVAADSLGKLKARQALIPLRELLDDPDHPVRYSAARALVRIGDKKGLQVLCEMLRFHPIREACGQDRVQAAEMLGALGNRTAVPALIVELQDADPEVRQAAARALARLKDRRAVAPLLENLWHHDPAVRKATATALAALTGRQFGTNAERWFAWWKKQQS